jgi:hypothetical protein
VLRLYPFPPAPKAPRSEKRDMAKESRILVSARGTVNRGVAIFRRDDGVSCGR